MAHVWLKIIWLKSSNNPVVVKSLFGSHQENVARLPALRNEWMRGVARLEKDNAPVQWPQSEGGDPTEGLALGRLLRKPTPN